MVRPSSRKGAAGKANELTPGRENVRVKIRAERKVPPLCILMCSGLRLETEDWNSLKYQDKVDKTVLTNIVSLKILVSILK